LAQDAPHNIEAEQAVLGAVLIKPSCLHEVASRIPVPDEFYLPAHREIWQAMVAVEKRGAAIDPLTVADELKAYGTLSRIEGGEEYLTRIARDMPTAENVSHYAAIVHAKSTLRRLQLLGGEIAAKAAAGEDDPAALVEYLGQQLVAISRATASELTHVGQLTETFMAELQERVKTKGAPSGFSWGIDTLDAKTGGIKPPLLVVLAARPGLGKSAFAAQIAVNAAADAAKRGGTALFFSLEMGRAELVERLFAHLARTDSEKLRTGGFDWDQLYKAKWRLEQSGLYVEDSVFSFAGISALARRWRAKHPVQRGLIVVDYVQLAEIQYVKGQTRERAVAEISRNLKKLAKELHVPVLAISQLNRRVEEEGRRPRLSDLRESGALEQDADVVVFIHRENREKTPEGPVDLIIAKNRGGQTGIASAHWTGRFYAVDELEPPWQQDAPDERSRYAD
jgi:replicative DNA helicase